MSYSPVGFCNGLEGAIQAIAMSASNAGQAERQIDRSGPHALARMTAALDRERRKSRALGLELQIALERLAAAEAEITRRPRGRR